MPTSTARVVTDRPERYARQLADHLGRRNAPVTEPGGVRLIFTAGSCLIAPGPGHLLLTATADDVAGLGSVQDVVTRHLERMGSRDGLVVGWVRADEADEEIGADGEG